MRYETTSDEGNHLSEDALLQFQHSDFTPDALFEADDHLRSCARCRSRLYQLVVQNGGKISSLVALTQAFGREEIPSPIPRLIPSTEGIPTFETLAGYVNGTLSSSESTKFEDSFARFPTLPQEVEDLRAVRRELEALQHHERQTGAIPPMRVARPFESLSEKPIRVWWHQLVRPLQTVSAAGVVAALLFVFIISPQNRQLLERGQYQQRLGQIQKSNQQLNGEKKRLNSEAQRLQSWAQQARRQSQEWKKRWQWEHATRVEQARNNESQRERKVRQYEQRIKAAQGGASSPGVSNSTKTPVATTVPPDQVNAPVTMSQRAPQFEPSGVVSFRNGQLFLSTRLPTFMGNTRSGTSAVGNSAYQLGDSAKGRVLLVGWSSNLSAGNPAVKRLTSYYQEQKGTYIRLAHKGERPDVELSLGWQNTAPATDPQSSTDGQIGYYLRLVNSTAPMYRIFVPSELDGNITDEGEDTLKEALENYVVQQKLLGLSNTSSRSQALLRLANIRLYRVRAPKIQVSTETFEKSALGSTRSRIQTSSIATFHTGEGVEFKMDNPTKQNLYIVALSLSQTGQVVPLPILQANGGASSESNSNTLMLKPRSGMTFGPYKVTPPTGLEKIKFIVSTVPIRWVEELEDGAINGGKKSPSSTWAAQTFTFLVK